MQRREIAITIILSLVTCGIYGLLWFIWLTDDANQAAGNTDAASGGMAVLLTIITCGIYGLFWAYKLGENISTAKILRNQTPDPNLSVLYLVLSLVGLQIVVYALAQNELNQMVA